MNPVPPPPVPFRGSPIILLIEDDPGFTYLMQRYVQRSGCRLVTLKPDEATPALIQQTQPAVLVLDVASHPQASLEMLRTLKSDLLTSEIPVVVCSELEQEARSLEIGAEVYLSKPVMYYDFLTALADTGVLSPIYPE